MKKQVNAIVKGRTERGKQFMVNIEFEIIKPKKGDSYYGNGCYMIVNVGENEYIIDTRYAGTNDVKELAIRWIKGWYGDNAKEVVFE